MPKLPSNLVKPPVFDNPLRRTTSAPASLPEPSEAELPTSDAEAGQSEPGGGVVIPIATNARPNVDPDPVPMPYRITVRIDDQTRRALEAECYRRRIAGEKTNVADIARGILRSWANRTE